MGLFSGIRKSPREPTSHSLCASASLRENLRRCGLRLFGAAMEPLMCGGSRGDAETQDFEF
mgnify:FL=1